jgi:hypothetical protein
VSGRTAGRCAGTLSPGPMRTPLHIPIILAMPRPLTASKVLLVADRRTTPASRRDTPIRRYRIARLRLEGRRAGEESRFDYLKRVYD